MPTTPVISLFTTILSTMFHPPSLCLRLPWHVLWGSDPCARRLVASHFTRPAPPPPDCVPKSIESREYQVPFLLWQCVHLDKNLCHVVAKEEGEPVAVFSSYAAIHTRMVNRPSTRSSLRADPAESLSTAAVCGNEPSAGVARRQNN